MTIAGLMAALESVGATIKWRKVDAGSYYSERYPDRPEVVGVHAELPNGATLSVTWDVGTYSNLAPDRRWDAEDGPTYEAWAWLKDGSAVPPPPNGRWYDVLSWASVWEIAVYARGLL